MIKRLFATSLAITFGTTACATTADPEPSPATVVVAFDRDSITPLIVEGIADRETGRPVEANDPVRIASISKLIMALAALRLSEEGVVDLEADVSDYLGWQVRSPNFPNAEVTLAQLLSHRSGLRDNAGYVIPLGESLKAKLADPEAWYVEAPPGKAPFEYANLGSPVVATVLEAATGERYARILERTVFAPLSIEACANWIGCSDEMVASAVTLYRDTGEVARDSAEDLPPNCTVPVAEGKQCDLGGYMPGTNASIFSPQGGIRIGMMDLAKIGQAMLRNDPAIVPEAVFGPKFARMLDERIPNQDFFCFYALGFQTIGASNDRCDDALFGESEARAGHAGEAYGLRSGLWFNAGDNIGIAYFTTAVPPRQGREDEGGFSEREKDLMKRAQTLLAEQTNR
ncbi:serine hydrolase domain-containing protein [Erythrobacter sp. W53]|uniref:serine hydrolase domain-containing protein n=1 Tax=Erythrobacter sp. W53 TaxID=3425947 RepID=UPI003D766E96